LFDGLGRTDGDQTLSNAWEINNIEPGKLEKIIRERMVKERVDADNAEEFVQQVLMIEMME